MYLQDKKTNSFLKIKLRSTGNLSFRSVPPTTSFLYLVYELSKRFTDLYFYSTVSSFFGKRRATRVNMLALRLERAIIFCSSKRYETRGIETCSFLMTNIESLRNASVEGFEKTDRDGRVALQLRRNRNKVLWTWNDDNFCSSCRQRAARFSLLFIFSIVRWTDRFIDNCSEHLVQTDDRTLARKNTKRCTRILM